MKLKRWGPRNETKKNFGIFSEITYLVDLSKFTKNSSFYCIPRALSDLHSKVEIVSDKPIKKNPSRKHTKVFFVIQIFSTCG